MSNIWSVLSQSATVFMVAVLVFVVQKLFCDKLNPKWQSNLWYIVIIMTFFPVGFLGTASFVKFQQIVDTFKIQREIHLTSAYTTVWESEFVNLPFPIIPKSLPNSITDLLFLGYILWVILSFIYFILSYLKLKSVVSKGVEINLPKVFDIAKNYDLPVPTKIIESKFATTPFVMGFIKPKLVLPLGEEIDDKIIIHELLHIKRKDVFLGLITTFLRCLQPCLWYFCNQMDNDRERACDQEVLELLKGEERRDYGIILLSMINNKTIHTPGATAMANGGKHIKKRIDSIVNFRKFPKGMEIVSFCMIFVLLMTIFGGSSTSAVEYQNGNYAQSIAFGQNSKPKTLAAALDLYTTGRYKEYWRKSKNLAYLAAVTAPEDMENLYLKWKENSKYEFKKLENTFRTGPIIRGLSLGENGEYICEIYFFRDVLGEEFDIEYRKTTVSFKENQGYWTVKELGETQGIMSGDDTMYLQTSHSPVVWTGEVAGVEINVSYIGTTCVNAPFKNGYNLDYQCTFSIDPNERVEPSQNSKFWAYKSAYYVSVVNQNDNKIDNLNISFNFENSKEEEEKVCFENLEKGENNHQNLSSGGLLYFNNIDLEDMPIWEHATAVVEISGEKQEITLEKEVVLP